MTKNSKSGAKKKRQPKKYKDLALYGRGKVGTKRWKIDYDYLNELTPKEKDFLNSFTEEYYLANFPKDKKTGKYKAKLLKSDKSRRKSYNENNASNRDILSLHNVKVKGQIVASVSNNDQDKLNKLSDLYHSDTAMEDRIISKIDAKEEITEEVLEHLIQYLKK